MCLRALTLLFAIVMVQCSRYCTCIGCRRAGGRPTGELQPRKISQERVRAVLAAVLDRLALGLAVAPVHGPTSYLC